jgi:hypothetical protein
MKQRKQDPPPGEQFSDEATDRLGNDVVSISQSELEKTLYPLKPAAKTRTRPVKNNVLPFPSNECAQDADGHKFGGRDIESRAEWKGTHHDRSPNGLSRVDGEAKDRHKEAKAHDDTGHDHKGHRASRLERLENLIELVENKLLAGELKSTVADWIRLTEIEREMVKTSGPREVRVTWVTPTHEDVKKVFGPRKRSPKDGQDAA